ncbi:MAG: prepilin-type N-terminal cleavage/methylation domain-containing protein [Candidatus Omnitrophica bacterium]|nr:prepilin-type N-terminal cleavage/methylation domain-containing protein [Candidatus Omnitrophota bacterium]
MSPNTNRPAGFSLIELMVVLGVAGIFLVAVQESVIHGLRVVDVTDEREEVQEELAFSFERLTRELAQAITFTTADATQVVFTVDLNEDDSAETVDYSLSNGQLVRTESGTSVSVVKNAQSVSFAYTDLDGNSLSTPVASGSMDDIRVVTVSVTADLEDETITVPTAVFVRNLFYAGS